MKILKLVDGNSLAVLDVGCASGYLARELQKKGHVIYGIEFNEVAAKEAGKYCRRVWIGDVETMTIATKEKFDVIIMADFLAHLKYPENVLGKFIHQLNEGGYIIASTGNVANIYIRLMLLLGRFDYVERGILDKTHLRLYTLKTFIDLFKNAGLQVTKIDVTPIPLPIVFPNTSKGKIFNFIHQFSYLLSLFWKRLFAYQFIAVAKPGSLK